MTGSPKKIKKPNWFELDHDPSGNEMNNQANDEGNGENVCIKGTGKKQT